MPDSQKCMEALQSIVELYKFTKNELVEIILKCIPDEISLGNNLKELIISVNQVTLEGNKNTSILQNNVYYLCIKNELKVAKVELEHSK